MSFPINRAGHAERLAPSGTLGEPGPKPFACRPVRANTRYEGSRWAWTGLLLLSLLLATGGCSDTESPSQPDAADLGADAVDDPVDRGADPVDIADADADQGVDVAAVDTADAIDGVEDPGGDAADVADAGDVSAEPDLADVGAPDVDTDTTADRDAAEPPVPLAGFGTIAGECGVLDDTEWSDSGSFLFLNALDFADDAYDAANLAQLSAGGQEIIADGNLSESSLLSEVFAFEMLYRCELAELLKTETEITYADPNGDKTDLLVIIDGRRIGVSVTRAHPLDNPFDVARAQSLLEQKLQGVLDSTANVASADVWERQILHFLAADEDRAQALQDAYPLVSESLRSSTLVIVTRTDGQDDPVYCLPPPCP